MDFLGYKNKRVIVSGCFSGMGEATARRLLELGAEVHGMDFKETSLDVASFNQIDLRDPATIDAAVEKIGGKVDALFNCAGLPNTFPAMDVMKVNYAGTRHLIEKVVPLMPEGSAIANISSNGGMGWSRRIPELMKVVAIDNFDDIVKWSEENPDTVKEGYAFSKEMIIMYTMVMSQQLIKKGIRINCTLPGPTQTPMTEHFNKASGEEVQSFFTQPINRPSTPQEQADPLVFLNSDGASYMNGMALAIDAGFMAGVTTGQIDIAAFMGGGSK